MTEGFVTAEHPNIRCPFSPPSYNTLHLTGRDVWQITLHMKAMGIICFQEKKISEIKSGIHELKVWAVLIVW